MTKHNFYISLTTRVGECCCCVYSVTESRSYFVVINNVHIYLFWIQSYRIRNIIISCVFNRASKWSMWNCNWISMSALYGAPLTVVILSNGKLAHLKKVVWDVYSGGALAGNSPPTITASQISDFVRLMCRPLLQFLRWKLKKMGAPLKSHGLIGCTGKNPSLQIDYPLL